MRVFITGATGFIGRHVLNELNSRGIESLILSRRDIAEYGLDIGTNRVIIGELADISSLKNQIAEFAPEACIHLAWEGIPDYSYGMSERNLQYGLALLRLCGDIGCTKVIMTGSCWEYDNPKGIIAESAPTSAENGFKAAKSALRMMGEAFCRENDMVFQWLRLFYVYGGGQKPSSLIPSIIRAIRNGEAPRLNTPLNSLDYIYVKDVAACIVHVLTSCNESVTLNVGTGVMTENLDILKIVAGELGVVLDEAVYKQDADTVVSFGADTQRLGKTGFEARRCLADGIADMLRGVNTWLYEQKQQTYLIPAT